MPEDCRYQPWTAIGVGAGLKHNKGRFEIKDGVVSVCDQPLYPTAYGARGPSASATWPILCMLGGVFPRISQPVEKVGIELIATANRAPKAPKSACLVPDLE